MEVDEGVTDIVVVDLLGGFHGVGKEDVLIDQGGVVDVIVSDEHADGPIVLHAGEGIVSSITVADFFPVLAFAVDLLFLVGFVGIIKLVDWDVVEGERRNFSFGLGDVFHVGELVVVDDVVSDGEAVLDIGVGIEDEEAVLCAVILHQVDVVVGVSVDVVIVVVDEDGMSGLAKL